MKEIIIKDKRLQKKFDKIRDENKYFVTEDIELLIKNIIVLFKRHSKNEDILILALLYWFLYFWIIKENNKYINKRYKEKIKILEKSLKYELSWDYKKYINSVIKMDNDLFLFKITIKYCLLSFEDILVKIIDNKENYYKSIWYLLPYLTYKESHFLWFFQDYYFKKVYPKKYEKIKKIYIEKISKIEFPWEHVFTVVNNTTNIMQDANVIWKTKIRKKTYFSIYNKMVRKKWEWVMDTIWMRIIFKDLRDLYSYIDEFEQKYVFIIKKDYINNPKDNWYKSIHYRYVSPYRNSQIMVELQLRTLEMDEQIRKDSNISHFKYTVNNKKWSKLFKEVHKWYNYTSKKLEIKK